MKNKKNQVELVGRLGANPAVKSLTSGEKVVRFSIAESGPSLKKGVQQKVQWHAITAWGKMAELAEQTLHKGTQVRVTGKLNVRSYVNKQGVRRNTTEVVATEF